MKNLVVSFLIFALFLLSSCAEIYLKMSGGRDLMTEVKPEELNKYSKKISSDKNTMVYVVKDSVWLRAQNLMSVTSKLYDKTGNCVKIRIKVDTTTTKQITCSAPFYNAITTYQKDGTKKYLQETILDEAKKWQNTDYTDVDNTKLLEKVANYDLVLTEYFWVNKGSIDIKHMKEVQKDFINERKDLKVLYIKICTDKQAKWNLTDEQLEASWKKDTTGLKVKRKKK